MIYYMIDFLLSCSYQVGSLYIWLVCLLSSLYARMLHILFSTELIKTMNLTESMMSYSSWLIKLLCRHSFQHHSGIPIFLQDLFYRLPSWSTLLKGFLSRRTVILGALNKAVMNSLINTESFSSSEKFSSETMSF
jgi:hypothetical protein